MFWVLTFKLESMSSSSPLSLSLILFFIRTGTMKDVRVEEVLVKDFPSLWFLTDKKRNTELVRITSENSRTLHSAVNRTISEAPTNLGMMPEMM